MVVERGANVTSAEARLPAAENRAELRPWLAFSACSAIWGSTFLVISIGNDALAPVWAATLRLVLATVLLGVWSRARGDALPTGAALRDRKSVV